MEQKNVKGANSKLIPIIVMIIALIGVIYMCIKSAIIGIIIFGVAFLVSLYKVKSDMKYEEKLDINYIIGCVTKEDFLNKGVYALVTALLPIIVVIFFIMILFIEPSRQIDQINEDFNNQMESINEQYNAEMQSIDEAY